MCHRKQQNVKMEEFKIKSLKSNINETDDE